MLKITNEEINDINKLAYNEEKAVTACLDNMWTALEKFNEKCEQWTSTSQVVYDHITITVNGVTHDFILGGPQCMGLEIMMRHIADEQLYDLKDFYAERTGEII